MGALLRVLIIEDSQDDTELLLRELRRGGYNVAYERVETREAMKAALDRQPWDLILSDHAMPKFSAPGALRLLHDSGHDIPFIIVSGIIGEVAAATIIKLGAHDVVLKSDLSRLVPVAAHELQEAEVLRNRQKTEDAKRREHHALQTAYDKMKQQLAELDPALPKE
jgi:DNA-binding NtrC family response regulator